MSLHEYDLRRRAFFYRESLEWDRVRWLMCGILNMMGGKQNPSDLLHLPMLDRVRQRLTEGEMNEISEKARRAAVDFFKGKDAIGKDGNSGN